MILFFLRASIIFTIMKNTDTKKPRKKIHYIISGVAIVVLALLIFGDQGFLDMYRLRRTDKVRAAEIVAARETIDSLKNEIERLKNDTAYIERLARELLGMSKSGEKVFRFLEEERE